MEDCLRINRPCCELGSVLNAVAALCLSGLSAWLSLSRRQDIEECLSGLSEGVDAFHGLMWTLVFSYIVLLVLNAISAATLLLSHFAIESLEDNFVMHCLTSSRALGTLMSFTVLTFLLQLIRLGYTISLQGAFAFLSAICNRGPGVVYLAQELIYTMGNASLSSGGQSTFNPYSKAMPYGAHVASSGYLDMDTLSSRIDLMKYCKSSDNGKDGSGSLLLWGCLLSVVSQALMAVALNGEKERVIVHEQHEMTGFLAAAQDEVQGAFSRMSKVVQHPMSSFSHAMDEARGHGRGAMEQLRDQVTGHRARATGFAQQMHDGVSGAAAGAAKGAGHLMVDAAVAMESRGHDMHGAAGLAAGAARTAGHLAVDAAVADKLRHW